MIPLPSKKQLLTEAAVLYSPWLVGLVILNVTGISLWMIQKLDLTIATAFVAGVFLGVILSEGPLQMFSRILSIFNEQKNIGEFKRTVRRSYLVTAFMLLAIIVSVFVIGYAAKISSDLIIVAVLSCISVFVHRISFLILYALKKIRAIFFAYVGAFAVLLSMYYLLPFGDPLSANVPAKYFLSLGSAFAVLLAFAAYHHYRIASSKLFVSSSDKSLPTFYISPTYTDKTIKSKLGIQFIEMLPYSFFGIFYFLMIFSDRFLSWIFNPSVFHAGNKAVLPFIFNYQYHIGADVALLVLVPAVLLQYFLTAPLYILTINKASKLKTSKFGEINKFFQSKYKRLIIVSIVAAIISAAVLNIFASHIMSYFGGSATSLQILRYASIGNIFLSVFGANIPTLMFLNKAKTLAIIALFCTGVVTVVGVILAQYDFADIVFGYLISTIIAAGLSTLCVCRGMKDVATIFSARYF